MEVSLAGGEPFLRKDLVDLLQGIAENKMRFSIISNGTLITDTLAEEVASTHRCNTVQVSIDGSTAVVHDSCRGTGSFKRAVAGIRCLQEHGIPVSIRVTIHHWNVQDLEHLAMFLLDELELPSFSTNSAGYFGLCQHHSADVYLTVEDRVAAMATLVSLEERYPGRITANAGPLAEAKMFLEMEQALNQSLPALKGGGYLTGCNCTWQKIAVRADGVITPCYMLPHLEMGRINKNSLHEIWECNPILQKIRNRSSIPLLSFPYCLECPYIPYCTGNCPAGAYAIFNEECHPSPEGCYRLFLEEGGTIMHHAGRLLKNE